MVQEKNGGAAHIINPQAAPSIAPEAAGHDLQEGLQAVQDEQNVRINDEHFIRDLARLKELRSFLIQEAVHIDTTGSNSESPLSFGRLNLLRFSSAGRVPTETEWRQVEQYTWTLFSLLTEPLRRRFMLGEVPWWMAWLPIIFAGTAVASLILAIAIPD